VATILQELREFMFVTGILVHIVEHMLGWIFVVISVLDFGQKKTQNSSYNSVNTSASK
jgi:hypothetical protein